MAAASVEAEAAVAEEVEEEGTVTETEDSERAEISKSTISPFILIVSKDKPPNLFI